MVFISCETALYDSNIRTMLSDYCQNLLYSTIKILPSSTVFISIYPHCKWDDGPFFPNLDLSKDFITAWKLRHNNKKPFLVHCNHEVPWASDTTDINYMG